MKIFYSSFHRFESKIIRRWTRAGFVYNTGHIQLLRYSWRTSLYWANRKGERVSEKNRVDVDPVLF